MHCSKEDYFTDDLWNNMKINWRESLQNWTPSQLSQFLYYEDVDVKKILPLSFLAFKVACKCYSLQRKSITDANIIKEFFKSNNIDSKTEHQIVVKEGSEEDLKRIEKLSNLHLDESILTVGSIPIFNMPWSNEDKCNESGQCKIFEHVFRKHLKPKKQHEVRRLAYLAALSTISNNTDVMVDVGSGQGHLSRLMAYGYKIPVICLDAETEYIKGARKFDLQLEKFMSKNQKIHLPNGPRHSTVHINDQVPNEFVMMINEQWPEFSICNGEQKNTSFTLVGLHTCGDLASSMLNLFCASPDAHSIISVGCCYMKLSDTNKDGNKGYPMSQLIRTIETHKLSYAAKEMACHAIDIYFKKLKIGADDLKVHCYRAVIETLMVKKDKSLKHAGLRSVNNAHLMPFSEWSYFILLDLCSLL